MHKKQILLFQEAKIDKHYGGNYLRDKRKTMRPLSTKLPIHLILRSDHKSAHKAFSYHCKYNGRILESIAKRFHIKIYQRVFNHTHLHLVIQIPSREAYVGFIRVLTARLSELANLKSSKLFTHRPFTRILSWGREYKIVANYIKKNIVEAISCIEIKLWEIPPEFRRGCIMDFESR